MFTTTPSPSPLLGMLACDVHMGAWFWTFKYLPQQAPASAATAVAALVETAPAPAIPAITAAQAL
eukprot:gene7768-7215_t